MLGPLNQRLGGQRRSRRTYLIVATGVLASAGLLQAVNLALAAHRASLNRTHLDQVANRLCLALQASNFFFSPSSGRPSSGAAPDSDPAPLPAPITNLGLTPVRPSASQRQRLAQLAAGQASTASLQPLPQPQAIGRLRRRDRERKLDRSCLAHPSGPPLLVISDPAQPELVWITPATPQAQRQGPWLQLRGADLQGSRADRIQLASLGSAAALAAAAPASRQDSPLQRRVHFQGQTLLLTLPPLDPSEDWIAQGLAWSLGGLALSLVTLLSLQSAQYAKHHSQLLNRLRLDRQTGLLSRQTLEQDLQNPSLASRPGGPTGNGAAALEAEAPGAQPQASWLLAMVTIRLLERQRAFLQDGEIHGLFDAVRKAVERHPLSGPQVRCYRASENRLAALLLAPPSHNGAHQSGAEPSGADASEQGRHQDQQLLLSLQNSVSAAVQRLNLGLLRDHDILVTGQRLVPGAAAPSLLQLHGFAEILASEAGSKARLIEPTDGQRVRQTAVIRDALRQLDSDDISLVFQPILLIANPGQFGLEVLVRFRSALLSQQGTGELIRIAHELGITHQIDALVISKVGKLQNAIEASPLLSQRIDYLSINISSDSVASPERIDQLIACLRHNRINSSRICLEFTETPGRGGLDDRNLVGSASERLIQELNFRIFIDDFGSGLSNYQRICAAWYDTIKLDIDLVSGLGDSFRMQRYVGSFIDTVHALGKTVVAEGVANHGDLAAAVRLGSDGLQGFLIARPMAWEGIATFLTTSPWASAEKIQALITELRSSDRLLATTQPGGDGAAAVPLERYILDRWYELRSFEEFLLVFVNELKRWGLDILRLSLAFLPDQDDIDCSQYIWQTSRPGDVTTLRMDRSFMQQKEHINSPLHHIATQTPLYRRRVGSERDQAFSFLGELREQGCNDYLGIRLDSRGISIPVLTIALRGNSNFNDEQIQRISSMSSLLSLLFYTFESERAKRLALLDPLTNLPNRRSFDSFLKSLVTTSKVNSNKLALVLVDIDRFKQVNDTLGHAYGDACLREVAAILNSDLRRNVDVVARLGGEEFAVILPDTDGNEALLVCERLREAVQGLQVPTSDGRRGMPLSISLGIAIWDPVAAANCDGDQLQQLADNCLYEAKRQGRNRVVGRRAENGADFSAAPANGGAANHSTLPQPR